MTTDSRCECGRGGRIWRGLLFGLMALTAADVQADTLHIDATAAAKRAVEVSHSTAAARKQVDAAHSDVDAADAVRLPTLRAAANAEERSSVPELTVPLGPSGPTTIFPDIRTAYSLGLDLTQPIYAGGDIAGTRSASRHDLAATQADMQTTEAGVALEARLAYWRAASDRAAVEAAKSQRKRAQRLQEDTQSLRTAGMAVEADQLAAEARVAAARLAVVKAQTTADQSMAALRSLLAASPDTELELADAMPDRLPPGPKPLSMLQAEARSQRGEVAAVQARVEATSAREKVAGSSDRPSVGATVAWNVARPNVRYLPLVDEWNDSWSVGISARWALWDGGRTRANVAAVQAKRGALQEQLLETERRVNLDVEQARLGLVSALAAVSAADASQKASAARLQAENERYAAGLSTTSDVLDAQSDLAAAETEQVRARTGAWMAEAKLEWAVGR